MSNKCSIGIIAGKSIKYNAKKLSEKPRIGDFKFSRGWLQNLKNIYNLKVKTKHGDSELLAAETTNQHGERLIETTKTHERIKYYYVEET